MRGALLRAGIGHFVEAVGEEGERIMSGWRREHRNLRVEKGKGIDFIPLLREKSQPVGDFVGNLPKIHQKKLVDGLVKPNRYNLSYRVEF